ncbi:acyl carrier protein [Streptococcus sp. S784/96/1]|uniref:acyl carrier protein n=1 Tax=Streptococcus sp. S784/96/1 TaxID=2653499 RepID=UPI001389EF1D|nr:acyl carrier protein [Streptococcus sp. S784/96/1]
MNLSKDELLESFKEILKIDNISYDDSFFELGGDSFDAIRLLHKLNLDIKIIDIFNNPSINSLFEVIENGGIYHNKLIRLNSNKVETEDTVVIAIPYGGGDVSIYKNFSKFVSNIPVYSVDTSEIIISSIDEFEHSVELIAEQIVLMGVKKAILYGHCAGSALALYLEKKLKTKIEVELFLAASIPILSPDEALSEFDRTTDADWEKYLHEIGGLKGLNSNEISKMLKKGRHDHIVSILSFKSILSGNSKSKATLIFGTCDPVTCNLEKVKQEWNNYISFSAIVEIPNAGHYFINDYADRVVEVLKIN